MEQTVQIENSFNDIVDISDDGDMGDIELSDDEPEITFDKPKIKLHAEEPVDATPEPTENTLQQQIHESDRKKLYKRGQFNDREYNIMRIFCKLGKSDIDVYIPAKEKKLTDEYVYGVNMYAGETESLPVGLYNSLNVRYIDFVNSLYSLSNRRRNILLQNIYKSVLANKYPESDEEYRFIYPLLKNGVILGTPKTKHDIIRMKKLQTFIPWLLYTHEHQSNKSYNVPKASVNLKLPTIKEKVQILEIPKEIQKMVNRPGKYFQELTEILKYNEANGFYSYPVEDKLIPVMCVHEYMTYQGKLPAEISTLCYKDGLCKYCGQEIIAYHEKMDDNVPVKMYDIIYKFIASIDINVDETMLLHSLYTLIAGGIEDIKHKTTLFNNNYETTIIAYAGVYLYAVYKRTVDGFVKYNKSKVNGFVDEASIYWLDVGWSKNQVTQLIKDNEIFPKLDGVEDIIKACIFEIDNKAYADIIPASVLLNKLINPREDIVDADGLNKLQKIFIQSFKNGEFFISSPMTKLNIEFQLRLLAIWRYINMKNMIKKAKGVNSKHTLSHVVSSINHDYEKFWNSMYKTFCPSTNSPNKCHEYNKSKCKYCGLTEDGKNKKEIYDKFIDNISGTYLQKPQLIESDNIHIKPLYTNDDINKFDVHVLDKDTPVNVDKLSFLTLSSVERSLLLKQIEPHKDQLIEFTKSIIDVNIKDVEYLKKVLAFIVGKDIMNANNLTSEIKNICFPIQSIDLILMSMNITDDNK